MSGAKIGMYVHTVYDHRDSRAMRGLSCGELLPDSTSFTQTTPPLYNYFPGILIVLEISKVNISDMSTDWYQWAQGLSTAFRYSTRKTGLRRISKFNKRKT